MKWLAWLLLLLNVMLFGYFRLVADQAAGTSPPRPELAVERLKVLDPRELASLPLKEAAEAVQPAPPPPALCYEWGSFSATEAASAQAVLDRMGLHAAARQQTPQEAVRYWVYIPPRKSMQEAQAKVEELRALDVQESFIVQEPKWRFAISLGVFKEEALADRFLEDIRSRGVRSAVKGQRNHEAGQTSYLIRDVLPDQADALGRLKPEFPGSELKRVDCQ